MKIVFMGTPDFAVGALEALLEAGHQVTGVVTQPDKPKGRSGRPQFSPVKECALRHGLVVLQPKRIKAPEAVEELRRCEADAYIVAAFGQIVSQEILDIPRYGCLNIHASLLPKYRGASPIQHALIGGEAETGVTIMQMDAGIDTGDMLYKSIVAVDSRDTFETLHEKLTAAGAQAIVEALSLLERGELKPEKQRDEDSCYAPMIRKSMGEIDFQRDARSIELLVRGLNPWPSAYTFFQGRQLKIWEAWAVDTEGKPGVIGEIGRDYVSVGTGKGSLKVYSLQLEGKRRMSARDFLLGVRLRAGETLGRS